MVSISAKKVAAYAPASITLFTPHLDGVGLALSTPGNIITAEPWDRGEFGTEVADELPAAEQHAEAARVAATATARAAGLEVGGLLKIAREIPHGAFGSLEATAVAAACAVNEMIGAPLRRNELASACMSVQGVTAGHVAAALHGGLILVRDPDTWDVVRLPVPEGLSVVAAEWRGEVARQRDPAAAQRAAMDLAALVSACHADNLPLLTRAAGCGTHKHVTGLAAEALAKAIDVGALGTCSNSGSIYALCRSRRSAEEVSKVVFEVLSRSGQPAEVFRCSADCPGARRL